MPEAKLIKLWSVSEDAYGKLSTAVHVVGIMFEHACIM